MLFIYRKTDSSGQDDDSISIISNDNDDAEEESEQVHFSNNERTLFGIRRRHTKVTQKSIHVDTIETAKDALEDLQPKLNTLEIINNNCSETEPLNFVDKIKYAVLALFGITGCYLCYKFNSMHIVSLNVQLSK